MGQSGTLRELPPECCLVCGREETTFDGRQAFEAHQCVCLRLHFDALVERRKRQELIEEILRKRPIWNVSVSAECFRQNLEKVGEHCRLWAINECC